MMQQVWSAVNILLD